jgi:hypothetical protein
MFAILAGSIMLAYLINIPIKNKLDMLVIFDCVYSDYFSHPSSSKFPFVYYLKKHNTDNNLYIKTITDNFDKILSKNSGTEELNELFSTMKNINSLKNADEIKILDIILVIFKYKNSFRMQSDLEVLYKQYKSLSNKQNIQYKNTLRINYILALAVAVVTIIIII